MDADVIIVDVAFPMQDKMSRGALRPAPDPRAIAAAASEGARLGHRELVRGLADGGRIATQISRATAKGFRRQRVDAPDMSVMDVRVVLDQIRITDPNDPTLDHDSIRLVIRVSLGGQLTIESTLSAEASEFTLRGAVVSINEELADVTVWRGLDLTIEVSPETAIKRKQPTAGRGSITLDDDPRHWLGTHSSPTSAADPWCLEVSIHRAQRGRRRRP
jgi:hypothetical protein